MDPLTSLSSELILRIVGFLDDAHDVVRLRGVNWRLNELGRDPLVWKRLFMDTFLLDKEAHLDVVDARLRKRARRTSAPQKRCRAAVAVASDEMPMSARQIASLPRLQRDSSPEHENGVDWYLLYKVSSNWQNGFFSSRQLHTKPDAESELPSHPPVAPQAAVATQENANFASAQRSRLPDTIVEITSDLVFTASRHSSDGPTVQVFPSRVVQSVRASGAPIQDALASVQYDAGRVSALAADRNADAALADSQRLLMVFHDGAMRLVTFDKKTSTFDRGCFYPSPVVHADETMMAAVHWPYIVTCSASFKMRIFSIDAEMRRIRLLSERRSFSCHWPACLRLVPASGEDKDSLRISIAYTNAVYPSGWSVSLQEVIFNAAGIVESRSASAKRFQSANHLLGSPSSNRKQQESSAAMARGSAIERLTSLTYEDPFIVVGSRDNSAFCFCVDRPSSSALTIRHVRTLHGHTGSVHSVSLDGGKCVTGGGDGSVRVWQLGDEQASIARAAGLGMGMQLKQSKGTVVTLRLPRHDDERDPVAPSIGSSIASTPLPSISSSRKRKRDELPLTLSDILRRTAGPSFSLGTMNAVRWVASAFDRIISVSGSPTVDIGRGCGAEAAKEHESASPFDRDEEVVQIWNFAA